MLFFLLTIRVGFKTSDIHGDTEKVLEYLPLFMNEQTRLCKIESKDKVVYHQFVTEFLDTIRKTSMFDPDYIKNLEKYTPKPYEKIDQMDFTALRALFTMLTQGEALAGRKDYVCQLIFKGKVLKMLLKLKELMT